MASSSSSSASIFHVCDASGQNENTILVENPDILRCKSLKFRESIDKYAARKSLKITLNLPDSKYGINVSAVQHILDNLQRDRMDVSGDHKSEDLARYCAALFHYECIPDLFKEIWHNTQPRSSGDQQRTVSPRESLHSWPEKRSTVVCGHLITISIVLGIQDVLEEELRFAVWGSCAPVNVLLIPVDIKALRQKELGKLFNELHKKLDSLENDNRKLVKRKRKVLKDKKLGDLSKSSEFTQNVEMLSKSSPYEFLWYIEEVFTGPHEAQTSSLTATPTNSQVIYRTLPTVSAEVLVDRFRRSLIKGEEPTNKAIREVMPSIHEFIRARQKKLAGKLIADGNKKIDEWREKLKLLNSQT